MSGGRQTRNRRREQEEETGKCEKNVCAAAGGMAGRKK